MPDPKTRRSWLEKAWREQALERFEASTEILFLILALAMIPVLLVPLLVDVPTSVDGSLTGVSWFIWAALERST